MSGRERRAAVLHIHVGPFLSSTDVHENFVNHDAKDMFAAGEPTPEPTAEPTAEPTTAVTQPSIAPTTAVTQPSIAPTTANSSPTVTPTTAKPSAMPTAQVTLRPSATPTLHMPTPAPGQPTAAPSARPTTARPTAMNSPLLSFNSNITMGGSLTATLGLNDQKALLNTTAWSMGVSVNTLTFIGSTATAENRRTLQESTGRRGLRSSGMSLFTTSWTVKATTQLNIPLDATAFTDVNALYSALTTQLAAAVNSGSFTEQLQIIALLLEADALQIVSVDTVDSSPASVNNFSPSGSGSNDDLSDGAIAGIVIGCVVGAALIAAALYYFCFLREGASKHEAFQSNSDVEISL